MNWYEAAFRKEYLDLYYRRDDAAAKREAAFAARALGLRAPARVLDVGCGAGRHARALAALGHTVCGVDLSRDLLAEAEGATRVRADMRALPFAGTFDAATSFFTSFGYFDDADNERTMRALAASLRGGGALLLDYLNAMLVERTLVPESEEERNGRTFAIRRRVEAGRVLKEVTFQSAEGTRRYTESVRLYLPHDLERMARRCGLVPTAFFSDFDGGDFTSDAPRCILVARKP